MNPPISFLHADYVMMSKHWQSIVFGKKTSDKLDDLCSDWVR